MNKEEIYIIFIVFIAAIGGFLLGFDGSVVSGAIPFYKTVFRLQDGSFMLGFSVSCIIWGAILGNLIAGPLSDRIGRKPCLLISALLFTATGLFCALANNIGVFIVGRMIGGVGVGIAILVAPVYIAEIAPPKKRGRLVSFNQLLIVIGLSAAYFSNYFILKVIQDPLTNWRWMLGLEIIPAIIYFIAILFIPESPRWLVMHNLDKKALEVLLKVRGPEAAGIEIHEIKKTILFAQKDSISDQLKKLFTQRMKKILVVGFGLGILQQFSGINAILYYAPMVFESAGGSRDASFMQSIVLGIVFVLMTVVSMFLIDRIGRKPLLYLGVGIMAVSLTVTGIVFKNARYSLSGVQIESIANAIYQEETELNAKLPNRELGSDFIEKRRYLFIESISPLKDKVFKNETIFFSSIKSTLNHSSISFELYKTSLLKAGIQINSSLVLIGILGFIAGFSISLGPVMWAILSEIFPNTLRGLAMSFVGAANAMASFLVATFFPIQLERFGSSGTYFIYAGFMYFCLWFVWKYVMETKGKSLEEIEKVFA